MDAITFFAKLLIYLSLLVFTIYSIVLGYHWFNYGTSRHTTFVAMIVFLSGSALLFLSLIVTYQYL